MTGGSVGDPPASWDPDAQRRLDVPPGFDLRRTALAHGGVGLAPRAWDGVRLHLRLPDPVAVEPDGDALRVSWTGAAPTDDVLRHVLMLDVDLEPLWQACDAVPSLRRVPATGTGRLLRSPLVWHDVVAALAQVRSSYRGAQARMRALVGRGAFPAAEQVAAMPLDGWGFRAPWVRGLAAAVATGDVEPQRWLDPAVPDDDVADGLRALPGVGAFTAAQLLPLLGRPRPLVIDGWLRDQLGGPSDDEVARRYAAMGPWAGTGAWLAALAPRLAPDPR